MRVGPVADIAWQEIAVAGLVLLTAYWVVRGDVLKTVAAVGDFGRSINEGIKATFDPNYAGAPLEMTADAKTRAEQYVKLGWAYWDEHGTLKLTPAGIKATAPAAQSVPVSGLH